MRNDKKTTSAGTEVVEQKSTAIVAQQDMAVNVQDLLSQAIAKNIPVETMERLLAMAEKMQAIKAKQEFDRAMAKFQSECPTIVKTKEVKTDSGQVAYRYAPIESIVEQVKQPLQDNGFSYSTRQELLENGVKVSVKVTHSTGHSEITEMTVPLGSKTRLMSESQVVAAASTFAKRYAFLNAFGIMTGDEDIDGQTNNLIPQAPVSIPKAPRMVNTKPVYEAKAEPVKQVEQSTAENYQLYSAAIMDAANGESLKNIGQEIRIAFRNKKLTTKDIQDLSKEAINRREVLKLQD